MATDTIVSTSIVLFPLTRVLLCFSMASREPKPTLSYIQIFHHLIHTNLFSLTSHSSFHKYSLSIYYVSDTTQSSIIQRQTKQIKNLCFHGTYFLATHICCHISHCHSELFLSLWIIPSLPYFLTHSYLPLNSNKMLLLYIGRFQHFSFSQEAL